MEGYPKRQNPRIKGFAYDAAGCYFITICTKNREHILSKIVGRGLDPAVQATAIPSPYGKIAEEELLKIPLHFAGTRIEKHVIMPDHVHFLLTLAAGSRPRPTVPRIVGNFKGGVSRKAHRPLWQASFHDHVIRNQQDYQEIWQYIDNNPLKWILDGKANIE